MFLMCALVSFLIYSSISLALSKILVWSPDPPTIWVVSISTEIFFAEPKCSSLTSSSLMLYSLSIRVAPVVMAISLRISFYTSPIQGMFTAQHLIMSLELLYIIIERGSSCRSSEKRTKDLFVFFTRSSIGEIVFKSLILLPTTNTIGNSSSHFYSTLNSVANESVMRPLS